MNTQEIFEGIKTFCIACLGIVLYLGFFALQFIFAAASLVLTLWFIKQVWNLL